MHSVSDGCLDLFVPTNFEVKELVYIYYNKTRIYIIYLRSIDFHLDSSYPKGGIALNRSIVIQ